MNATIMDIDMYKIKPLNDFQPLLLLPSCMYKTRSVYENADFLQTSEISEDSASQDTENYQLEVLEKLETLKENILNFKKELGNFTSNLAEVNDNKSIDLKIPTIHQDIVIKANPNYPPLSVWVFYNLLSPLAPVQLATYRHSSLHDVPKNIELLNQSKHALTNTAVTFTIIWKDMDKYSEMVVDPINQGIIAGEVNIARYLSRLLSFNYDDDAFIAAEIDYWLQLIHASLTHGTNKERNAALKSINSQLGKSQFLVRNNVSLADIALWSVIIQCNLINILPSNVSKWWKIISELSMFKIPLIN